MHILLSLLGTCALLANAINITAPLANSTQTAGGSVQIQWTTVDTDPSIFSILLVNFVNFPPSYVPLAYGVKTSSLSYTVNIPCDTIPSWGYQINAINGTNVFVIYAQSSKFTVTEASDPANCVSTSSPTPSGCSPPQTVYVTSPASTCHYPVLEASPPTSVPPTPQYSSYYKNVSSLSPPSSPTPTPPGSGPTSSVPYPPNAMSSSPPTGSSSYPPNTLTPSSSSPPPAQSTYPPNVGPSSSPPPPQSTYPPSAESHPPKKENSLPPKYTKYPPYQYDETNPYPSKA